MCNDSRAHLPLKSQVHINTRFDIIGDTPETLQSPRFHQEETSI